MGKILFIILLSFLGCASEKNNIKLTPEPDIKYRDFRIGVLFQEGISGKLREIISDNIHNLANVKLLSSENLETVLEDHGVTVNSLIRLSSKLDLPQIKEVDQLSLFYTKNNRIYIKSINFIFSFIRELELTDEFLSGKNWLLNSRSGWIFINSFPTNLEVYVNYKHMGYTPLLLDLKDGMCVITIGENGKALFNQTVNIPFSNTVFFKKLVERD